MDPSGAFDVLVVGGGLLGTSIALKAAQKQLRVLICRLSDEPVPQADTLRNQAWLQSGLRYVAVDLNLGKKMHAGGHELYDALGLNHPKGFGIVRLRDEAEAATLRADAGQLGIGVSLLNEVDVKPLLGDLFVPGGIYYSSPERPFEEHLLLRRLRERLRGYSGLVAQLEAPVTFERTEANTSSFVLRIDGRDMVLPRVTVLAAGAGNLPLLMQLQPETGGRLKLTSTPLLVVPRTTITAPVVFEDRLRSFTMVNHPPAADLPLGAMVIGAVHGTPTPFLRPSERRLLKKDCERFWDIECLKKYRAVGRFTAGFEVAVDGRRSVHDWVEIITADQRIVAAVPGRATLAMSVGRQISDEYIDILPGSGTPLIMSGEPALAFMHYHDHYEHLNDMES